MELDPRMNGDPKQSDPKTERSPAKSVYRQFWGGGEGNDGGEGSPCGRRGGPVCTHADGDVGAMRGLADGVRFSGQPRAVAARV